MRRERALGCNTDTNRHTPCSFIQGGEKSEAFITLPNYHLSKSWFDSLCTDTVVQYVPAYEYTCKWIASTQTHISLYISVSPFTEVMCFPYPTFYNHINTKPKPWPKPNPNLRNSEKYTHVPLPCLKKSQTAQSVKWWGSISPHLLLLYYPVSPLSYCSSALALIRESCS